MLRLKDTKLYQALVQRQNNNSEYYASFLIPLENDMDALLQNIKNLFPEYPDHGLQHSLRIIEYIGKIISEEQIKIMSSVEIFIFILASLFHDSGMVLCYSENKEEIRSKHHRYAEKVINLYFDKNLNNMSEKERIKDAVSFVCSAHGFLLEDLRNDEKFSRTDTISYEDVRYNLLAFLLRIGDLMDLEGERANNFRMYIYSEYFSEDSIEHNKRHKKVKLYNYSPKEIIIEVEAENVKQYKIWHDWFSFLEEDILLANTCLQVAGFYFPCPKTKIKKADGAAFDVQELRFEIDERGGIWEIISKSIYTNELDFLRELVQNAIDATLKKVFIDSEMSLSFISPRSWEIESVTEPILVCHSEKNSKLYVIDQGIGMDEEDLKNFLFKVSSSGSVYCPNREFAFPGIAQYGIGFVSCLINAEKIEIFTSKQDDMFIHQVTMESGLNVAFIQNTNNTKEFTGTVIGLRLNRLFSCEEILRYLRKTFCYTSVGVQFVNLDKLEDNVGNYMSKEKYITLLQKPYILYDNIVNIKAISNKKLAPMYNGREKVRAFEKEINKLEAFLSQNYIRIFHEKLFDKYNSKVDTVEKNIPNEELKVLFPDIKFNIQEKISDEEQDNIVEKMQKSIEKYRLKIIEERGKIEQKIDLFKIDIDYINLKDIDIGEGWNYFVVFFDSDFTIYNLKYSKNPIDISGKTGVIFFKHKGCDFQSGIEYVAINGFLFKNGQIFNRLARLTEHLDSYHAGNSINQESFVVGLEWSDYDIREEIREYYEGGYYSDEEEEDFYNPIRRFNSEYDVIQVENNKFVRTNNVSVFKTKNLYSVDDEYEDKVDLYEDIDVERLHNSKTGEMYSNLMELKNIVNREVNAYYQDGIAIPSKLNSLFPVGFFRIVCNCTADARMKLNVTRHEPSEIRTDIEHWISGTGKKIQTMIFDSLCNMLNKENLYCEFGGLIDEKESANYFEQFCLKSFKDILP